MKPLFWNLCPRSILENILWEDVDLDYDHYESSRAETIHSLLHGSDDGENGIRITKYWNDLSEETFQEKVKDQITSVERELGFLKYLLDKP